jgi:hypothetical protein
MSDRTFILANDLVRQNAITVLSNLPVDGSMQVVIGPKKKARTPDQNSLMWAGPLKDIAEQAWLDGKQYTDLVWHEYFKREFLPEDDCVDIDRRVTKTWKGKWGFDPVGRKILIGSTTQLSAFGMGEYMTELEAFAVLELGVRLHTVVERTLR